MVTSRYLRKKNAENGMLFPKVTTDERTALGLTLGATDKSIVEDITDGKIYRWSGTAFVEFGAGGDLGDVITTAQVSTPANPDPGHNSLYFKSDEKLYRLTATGNEFVVGATGAGTGDVVGPGSSTDYSLVTYNGTDGTAIRDNANFSIQDNVLAGPNFEMTSLYYSPYGAIYDVYVDTVGGSDITGTGLIGAPFQTIDRALKSAPVVSEKVRVLLADGTYTLTEALSATLEKYSQTNVEFLPSGTGVGLITTLTLTSAGGSMFRYTTAETMGANDYSGKYFAEGTFPVFISYNSATTAIETCGNVNYVPMDGVKEVYAHTVTVDFNNNYILGSIYGSGNTGDVKLKFTNLYLDNCKGSGYTFRPYRDSLIEFEKCRVEFGSNTQLRFITSEVRSIYSYFHVPSALIPNEISYLAASVIKSNTATIIDSTGLSMDLNAIVGSTPGTPIAGAAIILKGSNMYLGDIYIKEFFAGISNYDSSLEINFPMIVTLADVIEGSSCDYLFATHGDLTVYDHSVYPAAISGFGGMLNILGVGESAKYIDLSKQIFAPVLGDSDVYVPDVMTISNATTTPAGPSAGYLKIYFKNDNKLYKLTNTNVETEIGGTGGSGHTIQEEGVSLTARTNLNFVGIGITATDDAGNDQTDVTVNGNFSPIVDINSGPYNATSANGTILVTCSSADITVNLPAVATSTGLKICVRKLDNTGYNVIVDGNASELVEFGLTYPFSNPGGAYTFHCNGSAWYIVGG